MIMDSTFGHFIDGAWTEAGDVTDNVNPADTSDIIGRYSNGSAEQVDAAVAAARAAFPAWSRSLPFERGQILRAVADHLSAHRQHLATLLAREEGKTLAEALGEVLRAGQIFDFFAGETLRLGGEVLQSLRPGVTASITREPLGVIGIITPWNFPILIPAWKIASALAHGNTVVFKPAELVPASAQRLVDILARSGLPRGVVNMVTGAGRIVGQRLLDHRDVAAITFTGSVPTGRQVAASAVTGVTMKKVQLELGGKSPLVVLDDADLDNAVDCAIDGAFLGTGQRCTASSRLVVTEGIHDRFVAAVQDRLAALVVDNPLESGTDIGPVVDEAQLAKDLSYVDIGRGEGARLASGGVRLSRKRPGFYFEPALFTDVTNDMRIAREEIFGPVASVIRVRNYDEALAVANDTEFGLSSGICTTSLKFAEHFKRNSDAGMVKVNLSTSGVDFHLPFGGRKASSYGPREQGTYAREFFTQVKTTYQLPL
jgi:alpha-ketoglutaric semialdehyde dehydrogenase